ncbi:cellulase [Salipaludibacillus neizhouensis]|uniref:Cellulase n=1 Tax=Salipaludibacillus neizhouensis TaxID=885475 RepID=A0A3A9KK98_9BACI|nr:cellulase family glycosylhydrolase [Salipaludibacillus neizhouensis]RKL68225.1 cellulase [Salipaludibacillus neizhouensis]
MKDTLTNFPFNHSLFQKPKNLLLITIFLLGTLIAPAITHANINDQSQNNQESSIQTYTNAMQPGWNLGNSFDAVGEDETAWGNPYVTQEFIKEIAAEGYKSIRIPITWDERMEENGDYMIDPDFLARVDQAVNWALEEDMYVMINIHHDSWLWLEEGMQSDYDRSLARYDAIWTQLAEHFKDYSNKLMFESINEPRFFGTDSERNEYLNELNTSFHKIVRQSGGGNDVRPLVLPTMDTASSASELDALYDTIQKLNDPNIISTIHYYGYWPFSVNIAGHTTFDNETKNDIIATFDRVHDKFVANGIPVILGEYGLLGFDQHTGVIQQGEKLKFFEFMTHYAQEKQITHMLWDNGQHFNRHTFEWSDPELYEMMKASWTTRSSTAESNLVHLKKGDEIKDISMQLNLNGNEMTSLSVDGRELVHGSDYEVKSDVLIFKKKVLARLTNFDNLGVDATVTAHFDKGADWNFHLTTYDTPALQSAEGTANEFVIPTLFNGDTLATMEAVYGTGENAGPQNWTSFKEFAYTFKPSYDTNQIILSQNFFNEIRDGEEVILTFHFWSGEKITYTIIKEGDTVESISADPTSLDQKPKKKKK